MTEPQQPQWSPPPQQPAGWGPSGVAPVERPMGVTLAAIFLIVMGALTSLLGACVGVIGGGAAGLETQIPGFGAFAGIIAIFGVIVLILGIVHIVAGAGALGGKGWARWTGVVVAVVMAILFALGGLGSIGSQDGLTGGLVSIVLAVLYGASAWALVQANAYFAFRR